MVKTRSSSENEPCCSKACKKNTKSLNLKITDLTNKLFDTKNMIYHYKLEVIKNEKEDLKSKLTGFKSATKDLEHLIGSQRSNKIKEGLGYSVVPPPPAQLYSPPKKDLSWTSLSEFADDTVTDYSMHSPAIESTLVKRPTTDKVETTKKPAVKYAELHRKTTKRSTVRGNQRNWNNLKSQQLRENFVMKNKACFNCGHFNHLSYNCALGVKMGRSSPKNNYTHRSMPPRPAIHRPYRPPMRPVKPNINVALPKRTSFYKPAHSYNKRPFQETTQNLVAILIQRVKRLERELKARTPIQKADRGRS
nr:ubiquitin hydrolase [Tanacetum cinerariifolium]